MERFFWQKLNFRAPGFGLLLGAFLLPLAAQRPAPSHAHPIFGNPHRWQWAPDKTFHVLNYRLRLHFNEPKSEIFGEETISLTPYRSHCQHVTLDSTGLTIDRVTLAGHAARALVFTAHDPHLTITLPGSYPAGSFIKLRIVYHGFPKTGLFFINPDRFYPRRPQEIWSQGEPEDNQYWFPCWDYPNDKATSEIVTTVPAGQSVVSNGRLVSVRRRGNQVTYDWVERVPHSSYLISIAVGPWVRITQHLGRLPVEYYVPNYISRARALRSFGLTPQMIAWYEQETGVAYPYEKYAQTTVHNFTEGGMENISATTQTEWTLHDARAELDFKSQGLVSHELAHQWFGDLVTTRDWANIWLNEGFATFMSATWTEHHDGEDAYRYQIYQDQSGARMEDQDRYRRPVVDYHYRYPMQMFDATTYSKGAAVLAMLRDVLGNRLFWKSLHNYLQAHRAANVGTSDLMEAIRETSGRSLDWFFHEWIFRGGYPEYAVQAHYNPANHMESVAVRQTQPVNGVTPLFRMPVELAFYGAPGQSRHLTIQVAQRNQTFFVPLSFDPKIVDFDPNDRVLKRLRYSPPLEQLLAQVRSDPAMMSRLWAARQLGRREAGQPGTAGNAVAALRQALRADPFWAVRAEAATALAAIGGKAAKAALMAGLHDRNSSVRAGVADALGRFAGSDPDVFQALVTRLRQDPSYAVEAQAASSLGATRSPQAITVLLSVAQSPASIYVQQGVLAALAATGNPAVAPLLLADARPGIPERLRLTALGLLPRLKAVLKPEQTQPVIEAALDSSFPFLQGVAMQDAADLGLTALKPRIQNLATSLPQAAQRSQARHALERFAPKKPAPAHPPLSQLQRLEQRVRELEKQVRALQKKP